MKTSKKLLNNAIDSQVRPLLKEAVFKFHHPAQCLEGRCPTVAHEVIKSENV